jgi:UDP-2-acetamido-2,6-beta-L-arabino-hexul-4-ose reductase
MKVLITGSNGFIGKNLSESLIRNEIEIYTFIKTDSIQDLESAINKVDFIFHLAGVNRPEDISEFCEVNINLTQTIVDLIVKNNKKIPILLSSSTQVGLENDYAISKSKSEQIVENYANTNNTECFIYRLPNIFGKWSKPNYNSVIATWCYNIARDLKIDVNNKDTKLTLVYIGDVVRSFAKKLYRVQHEDLYCSIDISYEKTLGEIESLLYEFRDSRSNLIIPNIATGFERVLYATYLSFLPKDKFSYKLSGHMDDRGTFYEILKTFDSGQLGISTTKPGITRGNHYHNTKNEKFLVIKGDALIELRDINSKEIVTYQVNGSILEIVEMIPGYTHNITNIGNSEMVLLIWANENYDPSKPDTNFLEV